MKTVLQIIEEAGGLTKAECISIENDPWMRLVIEVLPERGPDGHVVVSVAHYGEQNGDPMRDPEMLFEVVEEESRQRSSGRSTSGTTMRLRSSGADAATKPGTCTVCHNGLTTSNSSRQCGTGIYETKASWKRSGDERAARLSAEYLQRRGVDNYDQYESAVRFLLCARSGMALPRPELRRLLRAESRRRKCGGLGGLRQVPCADRDR